MSRFRSLATLVVLAALAAGAAAQPQPVHVSVAAPEGPVGPGVVVVDVVFDIDAPYHVYAPDSDGGFMLDPIRTAVSGVMDHPGVRFLRAEFPEGLEHDLDVDYGSEGIETYQVMDGRFTVRALFQVAGGLEPGPAEGRVLATYQACDKVCYLPEYDEPHGFTLQLAGGGEAADVRATFVEGPVSVVASAPAAAEAGQPFDLTVRFELEHGYHIYAPTTAGDEFEVIRTAVSVSGDGVDAGEARFPTEVHDLTVDYGGGEAETYQVYEGVVDVVVPVTLSAGAGDVVVEITFQACDDQQCYPPVFDEELSLAVALPGGPGAGATAPAGGDEDASADNASSSAGSGDSASDDASDSAGSKDIETRLMGALAMGDVGTVISLSMLAALLAMLTPCVFPMIPITVSFFTKRAEASGGKGGARFALAYGLGIVATYTGFGLLLALVSAGAAQGFATNPWVNLAVGALFVYFGFSLLGFYDIKPPGFLARAAQTGGAAQRQGYLPVLLMGFVFTVTAFTCTAPVVGGLLAGLTTSNSPQLIVIGMLAFSITFALPFVLLAMFPTAMSSLPGAGGWMITVKVVMGFVELVAALKFLSNADIVMGLEWLPRPTILVLAILLLAALTMYLFGTYKLPHDVPGPPRKFVSGRNISGILFLISVIYLSWGLTGRELDSWVESYLPPYDYGVPVSAGNVGDGLDWHEDLDSALAQAEREGKRVFVDFTGITCVNCRQVEKKVFTTDAFKDAAKGVVLAKLFTDRRSDEHRAADEANKLLQEERFGTATLPLYVILEPDGQGGRELGRMSLPAMVETEVFLEFLEP